MTTTIQQRQNANVWKQFCNWIASTDYRLVRSLRLTNETWKALGIAAECNGKTAG